MPLAWIATLAVAERPRAHLNRELDSATGNSPALVDSRVDHAIVKEDERGHQEVGCSANERCAEVNAVSGNAELASAPRRVIDREIDRSEGVQAMPAARWSAVADLVADSIELVNMVHRDVDCARPVRQDHLAGLTQHVDGDSTRVQRCFGWRRAGQWWRRWEDG